MKNLVLSCLLVSVTSACAPGSFTSGSALGGTVLGAGLGAGAGAIANELDDKFISSKVIGLGAGIGAGLGLLGGAAYYSDSLEEEESEPTVRKVVYWDTTTARQIDATYQQIREGTMEGRGETKPWTERYLEENPEEPYQGPSLHPRTLEW